MNHHDPIVLDESSLAEVTGGATLSANVAVRNPVLSSYLGSFSASIDSSRALQNLGLRAGTAVSVLGRVNLGRFAIGGAQPI